MTSRLSVHGIAGACVVALGCGDNHRVVDAASDSAADFSFFVTSYTGLQRLSGNTSGFGGDLRFGETGPGAGLRGADKICAALAETSMPGAGAKTWRAFLSATDDGTGHQVDAIDRIGQGPWYDRVGRLLAPTVVDLLNARPANGDPTIRDDFPNEDGVPNHDPSGAGDVDNHDMLTGSNAFGRLYAANATCLDWTAATGDMATEGRPQVGHSWPRFGGGGGGFPPFGDGGLPPPPDGGVPPPRDGGFMPPDGGFPPPPDDGGGPGGGIGDVNDWKSALTESGCAPGANLIETGGPDPNANTVGNGGGYGGFYCFGFKQ
jgi:hypothetical protein